MPAPDLLPGDCLIYRPTSFLGRLIAIKSWMPYSHCEVVIDADTAIGARPEGVARYAVRLEGLAVVVRPDPAKLNLRAGLLWFDRFANGQRYDVWGLFRFFTIGKQSTDKQFCSELATRFYRHAGFPGLFGDLDADLIPPGFYTELAHGYGFTEVWRA